MYISSGMIPKSGILLRQRFMCICNYCVVATSSMEDSLYSHEQYIRICSLLTKMLLPFFFPSSSVKKRYHFTLMCISYQYDKYIFIRLKGIYSFSLWVAWSNPWLIFLLGSWSFSYWLVGIFTSSRNYLYSDKVLLSK